MRRKLSALQSDFLLATCVFAASNALAGDLTSTTSDTRALECDPGLRATNLRDCMFRREEDFAAFAKGLRDAGLPD